MCVAPVDLVAEVIYSNGVRPDHIGGADFDEIFSVHIHTCYIGRQAPFGEKQKPLDRINSNGPRLGEPVLQQRFTVSTVQLRNAQRSLLLV